MTVLEIMERVGTQNTARTLAYIKDALDEMQERIAAKRSRVTYNIADGTRLYNYPNDFVRLLEVYRKYDENGRYIKIDRVQELNIMEDSTASTVTTDDDIVVVL